MSNKKQFIIYVCQETPCLSMGAAEIFDRFVREIADNKLTNVSLEISGCHGHGLCERGPSIVIEPGGIFYIGVQADDIKEIVESHLKKDTIVQRLIYHDPISNKAIANYEEVNFYKKQQRIVLRDCGHINPEKIDDYISKGGYTALRKALTLMTPEQVISEITQSGLRGRGGAGFPTGRKWEFCRKSIADQKYMICNADEGDPGAFMDRSILEANPNSVIEGITIAGYAIGATEGYIYVRTEYPLAVRRVGLAIEQAKNKGFLGKNIFGSGFDFNLHIKEGAGAFVCGEETALIASIESRRGMPKPRPPFPAQSGLDGKPTIINNVKTLATISTIIGHGAEWFNKIGTEKSKGTVIFALSGKINYSGLVEVPMGTTLSDIIFDIGGGIPRERKFKAVQTGGPSGGCIPAKYLDTPVEYDTLAQLGSILGSGGMVVLDDATCMVEVARYFLSFTQNESCGKCSPCRLGTKQMLEILTKFTQGRGREEDLLILNELAKTIKQGSLCGLGQTCPNPILTTLNYFKDEYESHIKEKKCPAAVCDALMISPCQHTCPVGINVPKYVAHIAAGQFMESVETIRERNPFPAICGRICNHPCEYRCRRGELEAPVAIRSLKRFAADWYFEHQAELPEPTPFPRTKKQKIAIIGAGPTGLSCAYYLAQMGYGTTVFEALPVGGGMLSVAIPEFRLPKAVIEQEINYIVKRGVEIKYNSPINANFTVRSLFDNGYAAVFIAAGAQRSQRIGIPGELEDLAGFHYGLRFLRDIKTGKKIDIGSNIAVIGGGNVALDAARTAFRLGAKNVNVYYRRSREEMPVTEVEYDESINEGIKIDFLTSPTRIASKDWRVTGLQCVRMKLGDLDITGRRRPIPEEGSEFFVEADTVIAAVGQAPDLSFLPPDSDLERTKWETLAVDSNKLSTNIPGVFAGGDFVTGPGMVIEAIASGRRGALAINKYLHGDLTRVEMYDLKNEIVIGSKDFEADETLISQPRQKVPMRSTTERKNNFNEIEIGYNAQQATLEARRCLRCDLEK